MSEVTRKIRNGAEPAPTVKAPAPYGVTAHGIQIVVLTAAWVYVGEVFTDTQWVYIEKAQNIRKWGTTRGLGELAAGPTESTVLDPAGLVKAPLNAVVHMVGCSEAWRWKL